MIAVLRAAWGVYVGLLWIFFAVALANAAGVPTHSPPGEIDLTDFVVLGALGACAWLAVRRR